VQGLVLVTVASSVAASTATSAASSSSSPAPDFLSAALARLTRAELDFELATLASPRDLIAGYLQLALDVVPGAVGAALLAQSGEAGREGTSGAVATVGTVAGDGPSVACDLPPLRDVTHRLHVHRAAPAEDDRGVDELLEQILLPALAARLRAALAFEDKIANLHHALSSRQVIGQATGVLMERHRIDETKAFDRLVNASQQGHLKLREIAQRVVETGLEPNEAATAG
jgi:hypothetical protein